MKTDKYKLIIGRTIIEANINEDKNLVVLTTDKGDLFLEWEGDCCAQCYLAHVSGANCLVGSTVLEAEDSEWLRLSGDRNLDSDVVDSMGTKIKTTKGYVTLESRVEHNGYYGGTVSISEQAPAAYKYRNFDAVQFYPGVRDMKQLTEF